ncbi:MAG: PSD1 and planctomycete cytochrome C domain-containing protein [Isosphaeraceae bacterium]
MPRRTLSIRSAALWALLVASAGADASPALAEDTPRFNRDVRPVLSEACFRCHGPAQKKGGLRLDQLESALKKLASGATAIVPGDVDESEILRRIFSDDPDEVMPPPATKKPLKPEQKELLKRWVKSGAPYVAHWAFVAPVKPAAPKVEAATVNPIDAFLADRLKREGLSMSPEADRRTLIRRVSFALTGLPPTPQEVELFVGDASGRAYENMVERYLHSPRYGEEMARTWLDVARYADTHGLHLDNERLMWPYRDWVVKAFNDNKPFDQFTTEQIAGDQLPNPTPDQLVATGFSRCNVTTSEGGSIEAEWFFRNAVDRAATMAEAWLGLTAGCAVCHDHKFDPLPQREFYALYSFFYSAAGPPLDGNAFLHEPTVKLTTPEQSRKLADLDQKIAQTRAEIDAKLKSLDYKDPEALADTSKGASEPAATATDPSKSFAAWLKKAGAPVDKDAPAEVKRALNRSKREVLTDGEVKLVRNYYLTTVCTTTRDAFKPLNDRIASLTAEKTALESSIPTTYVFKDSDKPRDAFVMMRGQYDKPGDKVEPGTPAFLPALAKANPSGRATRLDLARWLVDARNPLTARVAVNRVWQQLFGVGLVKTSYDFGTQGEPPSHPELLDWLAVTYRESGWDTRALVRLMVNSAAFRQTSRVTPEVLRRDPENRLYARGPRFRLDAEQIRDNALFVSGLIDLTMGGKGVRPYQPPRIWEPVAFAGSNTMNYTQDHGSALYRRSLYTFLKRTAPPPFMVNFDAPSREAFCARRERSNTPLQALQLMNDVQHFEAARGLATRLMLEGGPTPKERIDFGFRVVLGRPPEAEEMEVVAQELDAHLARFRKDPSAAKEAVRFGESAPRAGLDVPELAAYSLISNMLLNLDETLNRN